MQRGRSELSNQSFSRRAFTLVELLVVFAIISVLASFLLPAVTRVIASARRTTCMNRGRHINMAISEYTEDYKRYYPSTRNTLNAPYVNPHGYSYTSKGVWVGQIGRYMGAEYNYSPEDPWWKNFNEILSQKWYDCPLQVSQSGSDKIGYNAWFGYSFHTSSPPPLSHSVHYKVKVTQVKRAESTSILGDCSYDEDPARYYYYVNEATPGQGPSYFHHAGNSVYQFADGHSKILPGGQVLLLMEKDVKGSRNYFKRPKDF